METHYSKVVCLKTQTTIGELKVNVCLEHQDMFRSRLRRRTAISPLLRFAAWATLEKQPLDEKWAMSAWSA